MKGASALGWGWPGALCAFGVRTQVVARYDKGMTNTMTTPARYSDVTEFWVVQTKRGPRAYYYGYYPMMRSFPMPYAVAELLEATGQATRVDKPAFVGGRRGW